MKTEDILVVIRDLYSGLYRGNKVIVEEVPPVGWNIVKIYKVSDQKKFTTFTSTLLDIYTK